jgi:hypothetical protein
MMIERPTYINIKNPFLKNQQYTAAIMIQSNVQAGDEINMQ